MLFGCRKAGLFVNIIKPPPVVESNIGIGASNSLLLALPAVSAVSQFVSLV